MCRPLTILLALGLVGATMGCHHTHGVCDCDQPATVGYYGPPALAPGAPPPLLRPVPVQAAPKPADNTPPPPMAETPK
jgi:hypothetical protein